MWGVGDSSLRIGLVGKTLVHYKHYNAAARRPPVQLAGKGRLEQFLRRNEAVLLSDAPKPAPDSQVRSDAKFPPRKPKKGVAMTKPPARRAV